MHLCNTKIHTVLLTTCAVTCICIRRPIFAANDDFRKKNIVEPGVLINEKRVKFNLCNVSETNDADLNLLPVFGCPHYAGLLLVPGRGKIGHLLTLGKC